MLKSPFEPCIPSPGTKLPGIHEIKHDGYRLIVQRVGQRVRLWTRNGHDWTERFSADRRSRCAIGTRR